MRLGSTMRSFLGIALCLSASSRLVSQEFPEPLAKNHQRIMYFIDEQGKEQRVQNAQDWQKRRDDIIRGLEAAMGKLPDRSGLGKVAFEVVPDSRTVVGGIVREKILIDGGDNDKIPTWVLSHEINEGSRPAIIAIHQTNGALGKDEVVGLGGNPNLHYGIELAKAGYVVVAPDYPTLGEYKYDFEKDRFASGSMKGIWNHMRCVDYLTEREDVNPDRIGAIGHSLGGHNSIFLGVMDSRIRVVVSSCGWTPHHDYYRGNLTGWSGERYVSRFKEVYDLDPNKVPFDYYELIAALAPRSFFSCSPIGDSNFSVLGVQKTIPVAQEVFELLGASNRIRVAYPDAQHDFPDETRWASYLFIHQALRHR